MKRIIGTIASPALSLYRSVTATRAPTSSDERQTTSEVRESQRQSVTRTLATGAVLAAGLLFAAFGVALVVANTREANPVDKADSGSSSARVQLPTLAGDPSAVMASGLDGEGQQELLGFRGPSYAVGGVVAPTGDKPQSKLWFNDGSWWGALYSRRQHAFTIHRLDWSQQRWIDTGVVLEPRETGQPDILWDGTWLYVASTGGVEPDASSGVTFSKYAYDPKQEDYDRVTGFPVMIEPEQVETVVLDKDSRHRVWLTYAKEGAVWVSHSIGNDHGRWVQPYVLPVEGATDITLDDISTLVAFRGGVAVMWSDQNGSTLRLAIHADSEDDRTWSVAAALHSPGVADDHINLKSIADGEEGLVAAVKTSLTSSSSSQLLLLVLGPDNVWHQEVFSTVEENHTRPLVVLEESTEFLHMFATAPCCGGGKIYHKASSLSSHGFPEGRGTAVIASSLDRRLNNVTSTKQTVSATTGLVILASDDHTKRYVHNAFNLTSSDDKPPDTEILTGPLFENGSVNFVLGSTESAVTYECSLDGAPFTQCAAQVDFSVDAGSHTLLARAIDAAGNVDSSPARQDWSQ